MAGAMPIDADGGVFLLHFVPYYLLNFLAFEEISRGYGRSVLIEQYNMARFASFAWSTLGVFRIRKRFGVTDKHSEASGSSFGFLLPQLAVVGLNALAIPVGIALFYAGGHLPEDGLWANVVWAVINTWLALLVVSFTLARGINRRGEYRFAMPLAARLNGVLGTVDDLSPNGLKFYGLPGPVALQDVMPITLYFPDGVMHATLEIRTLEQAQSGEETYTRSIGGTFQSLSQASIQRIEQFLFGSDAQWRINRYHEDSITPLQRLGLIAKPQPLPLQTGHWAGCEVVDDTSRSGGNQIALVDAQPENGEIRLLVYQTLNTGRRCSLLVHGRSGLRSLLVISGKHETILTGLGSLYLYRMTLLSMSAAPNLAYVSIDEPAPAPGTAMAA
jgi:cellulose synthase (UDP-forming)